MYITMYGYDYYQTSVKEALNMVYTTQQVIYR